jgi:hypothetical protein
MTGSWKPARLIEKSIEEPFPMMVGAVPLAIKLKDSSAMSGASAFSAEPAKSSTVLGQFASEREPLPPFAAIVVGTPPDPGAEGAAIERELKFQ